MNDTELLNKLDYALDHTEHLEENKLRDLLLYCLFTNSSGDMRLDIKQLIHELKDSNSNGQEDK